MGGRRDAVRLLPACIWAAAGPGALARRRVNAAPLLQQRRPRASQALQRGVRGVWVALRLPAARRRASNDARRCSIGAQCSQRSQPPKLCTKVAAMFSVFKLHLLQADHPASSYDMRYNGHLRSRMCSSMLEGSFWHVGHFGRVILVGRPLWLGHVPRQANREKCACNIPQLPQPLCGVLDGMQVQAGRPKVSSMGRQ